MNKHDIYEHLAEIYLDASGSQKKKKKVRVQLYKNFFLLGITLLFILTLVVVAGSPRIKTFRMTELALLVTTEPLKINFHFDPAKKEIYTINLNNLDLSKYKAIGFSIKRMNFWDRISLRIEFSTPFKERSEVYLKEVPSSWKDYKINLAEFQKISDWSQMQSLAFIVEEWNAKEKKDVIYIDNVRFLK